ncbi:MAG: PAS domain S-box protein [Pseudomonadota bacterium]
MTRNNPSRTWVVSPDLLSVVTADGRFEDINPAWLDTFGWTEQEVKGSRYSDFVHPEDLAATDAALHALRRGEPVLRFENRYRGKDGSYRWLSWVAVPEGSTYLCSARDITHEKLASEERDRLWALSEDMLARADYEGKMSAVNPAWTAVLGFSQRELLSRPYADFMHPDDTGVTLGALASMGQTGRPTRFENRILSADGNYKPIGWTVSPEPDGRNFIAVGRDLSDYKARERELIQAQEALRQAQKMEAVGQLTGGIAHDFNNLLNAISINLEMLSRRMALGQFDATEKYVNMALGAVRRGATLTQRLLAFSRRQTLDPQPVDVYQLVTGIEDMIRHTAGPEVNVEVQGEPGLWSINVDPSQLENSLLNLCINARDAMLPHGGLLRITADNQVLDAGNARALDLPAGDYVSVSVIDTGAGMPPDVMARAFDPFFTTKPLGQGTGLGLSMVYGFVRQSGGHVQAQSQPGNGTTMCMYFPRHDGMVREAETPAASELNVSTDGDVILLIDDEETLRVVVAEVLGLGGYQVLQAPDGPSGMEILRSGARVDLLITDVGLPNGMNGRQVADAARVVRPGLKVLFITGYAENAAVGNGLLDPGMHVLTKPFDMAALSTRVEELLER